MSDIAVPVTQSRAENTIGASQAAAALGLDPYVSPLELWQELRGGERRERPAFVREAADWGQALEPIIRGKYALSTGRAVLVPDSSVVRDEWLRCTPDGYAITGESEAGLPPGTYDITGNGLYPTLERARRQGRVGLVQVKTCSAYKRDDWATGVPPEYEVQVRVEMAVCGLPWCDVVCLVGGQTLVGPFRVERDLEIEARIVRDLRAFWDLVQSGTEPPVDGSVAWREAASSRMRPSKVVLVPDEDAQADIEAWKRALRIAAKAELEEKALKTKLLLRLSAAGATAIDLGAEGKITAYQTAAKGSWKDYAMSIGATNTLPDKYKGKPGAWTLRAPWGDDNGE